MGANPNLGEIGRYNYIMAQTPAQRRAAQRRLAKSLKTKEPIPLPRGRSARRARWQEINEPGSQGTVPLYMHRRRVKLPGDARFAYQGRVRARRADGTETDWYWTPVRDYETQPTRAQIRRDLRAAARKASQDKGYEIEIIELTIDKAWRVL